MINRGLVIMTSPPTEYFHVCENNVDYGNFDINRFIDLLSDYYHGHDIVNFGKFRIPVDMVASVDGFLSESLSSIGDYEFVDLTDSFFLCKAYNLYFHISWSIVNGFFVFAILHGVNIVREGDCVYVYHADDDSDTVVPLDFSVDSDIE